MTRHGWICSAVHTSGAGKMRNRSGEPLPEDERIRNPFRSSVHTNCIGNQLVGLGLRRLATLSEREAGQFTRSADQIQEFFRIRG